MKYSYHFYFQICKEEKKTGTLQVPLQKATARAANYTGLSATTVRRIGAMSLNRKPRKPRQDRYVIDTFDRDVIRRTVHEMLQKGGRAPTSRSILAEVRVKISFPGKVDFLRKILKKLGFVWRRCESNRSVLMERNDIVVARINFLRKIKTFKEEGRTIVYTDEAYVNSSHSMKKCWQSEAVDVKIPFSRGESLIVVHAGSKDGCIPGADRLFKAKSSSGDYHSTHFMKRLKEKLVPNLPPNSVVVVDNAACHNTQEDKCPTQSTRKADIQSWLERNQIVFSPNMLKTELLELCKRSKPEPKYILDEMLKQHGHECLRLPQYHAELNAIELIWAHVKSKVAAANMSFKMKDVLKLSQDAIEGTPASVWENCCRHVETVEEIFWKNNPAVEKAVERSMIEVSDEGTFTASKSSEYSDTDTAFEI